MLLNFEAVLSIVFIQIPLQIVIIECITLLVLGVSFAFDLETLVS